jgi:hypothetical protein
MGQIISLSAHLKTPQSEGLSVDLLHPGHQNLESEDLSGDLLHPGHQNPESENVPGDLLHAGQQISSLSAPLKTKQSEGLPEHRL